MWTCQKKNTKKSFPVDWGLTLHFWQNWGNWHVGWGRRVCSIQQQSGRLVRTSPNSKMWARGMAESPTPIFFLLSQKSMPIWDTFAPKPWGSTSFLPISHGDAYGDKQVAHSKVWRGISSLLVFKCSFLHQGNKAAGQGKRWTTLIWVIQHIYVNWDWFGSDS